ncbi:hypothetical protein D3C81_1445650 [compost metagenome]
MDRPWGFLIVGKDHLQLPAGDLVHHLVGQQPGNAQPAHRRCDRTVVAGHGEPGFDAHQGRFVGHAEAPAGARREVGGGDHRMRRQVRGMLRHTMARQVFRRGAEHAPDPAHAQGLEAGVGQRTDTHGNVHALLDHVDDAVEEVGGYVHLGVLLQITHDARHDEFLAEQNGRGDGQLAFGRGVDAGGGLVGLRDAGEDVTGVLQIAATRLGQAHAARGT